MASATDRAIRRFESALQGLELAVEQRLIRGAGAANLAVDVEMLTVDRAELAESLDQSLAKATRLESLNRDASKRIGLAVESIQAVLAAEAPD